MQQNMTIAADTFMSCTQQQSRPKAVAPGFTYRAAAGGAVLAVGRKDGCDAAQDELLARKERAARQVNGHLAAAGASRQGQRSTRNAVG